MRPASTFVYTSAILILVACCSSCGVFCRPRPSVTALSPNNTVPGGPQFRLSVSGDDFDFDSFVTWNGVFRPTTFISTHQLIALIPSTDIAMPTVAEVRVFTPGNTDVSGFIAPGVSFVNVRCGGGKSNALTVRISATGV